jgi:hypothetical protein
LGGWGIELDETLAEKFPYPVILLTERGRPSDDVMEASFVRNGLRVSR